jgi:hypothetical protein
MDPRRTTFIGKANTSPAGTHLTVLTISAASGVGGDERREPASAASPPHRR